ncbi:MAG TPA: PEP-CTERM sorting domain-containing protein [Bryobacteraceae bacterium]|nr:PEP-CTERM sorting domain-containing protein [Bryobacteraceae bacterium]
MRRIIVLMSLAAVSSFAAYGTTVCASGSTTTFGNGVTFDLTPVGTCSIGSVTFSNFFVTGENSLVPTTFAPSATLLNDGRTLSLTYTSLPTGADIQFGFESTGGTVFGLLLGGGSSANVTETVCTIAFVGESCLGGVLGGPTGVSGGGSALINLSANISGVYFYSKDITGGSGVTQTFVPEPMTSSLMGAGLLGLGFLRRYRKP